MNIRVELPSFNFRRFAAGVLLALVALLSGATSGVLTAQDAAAPARSVPTRPAAAAPASPAPTSTVSLPSAPAPTRSPLVPPGKRPPLEYVALRDLAPRLGCTYAWDARARRAVLTGPGGVRADFDPTSRESRINGLRVLLGDMPKTIGGQPGLSTIDAERLITPLLRPGYAALLPGTPRTIAIDPGHGGRFDGTENKALRLEEKKLALDVAFRLKKILEARGYRVVMTRTADVELAPDLVADWLARPMIANNARADLFVSIHFNHLDHDTRTSGTEVFTFPPQYQRSDEAWSKGADDGENDFAPVNRFDHWSEVLAQALHRDLLASLHTVDRGKKSKHLAVLRPLDCPGVLVECAFLSSDSEARRVATPQFRQQIAEGLAAGIRDYGLQLDHLRPPNTAAKND